MRRGWLAKVLMFAVLELGALASVPIRPDQIEELTRIMNNTQVVEIVRRETNGDDDPPA